MFKRLKIYCYTIGNRYVCFSERYYVEKYDIIIGAVANDDVYRTLQVYQSGLLSKEQALEALKAKKLFNQYVFATKESLALLKFFEAKEV